MAIEITRGGLMSVGTPFQQRGVGRAKKKKKKKEEVAKTAVPRPTAPTPKQAPKPTPQARGGVYTTAQTGRPSGVEIPGGRTFLGLSPGEVAAIQAREGLTDLPTMAEQAAGIERERRAAGALGEAGAFEEVVPGEVPLSPFTPDIPILGPSIGAGSQIAAPRSLLGIARDNGWVPSIETGKEAFPETEETLREAELRQIKINSFDEGLSLSEKTGAAIEAIPLVGSAVGKYVGGLVEAPYNNAMNVVNEINRIKEAASTGQEKVRNNLESPDYGLDRARKMEEDLAKLEGRLKLLINSSAVLRANSDQVNLIQEQVLEAREKVNRYRMAASFGLTAEMTGTGRVVPTDEQIYFQLKEQNE